MNEKIKEIKEKITSPLRQATLVFLIRDNEILLAMKKRGFGMGKWNGVGGKKGEDETIEEAAIREAKEEIGVTVKSINKVATINFYFSEKPEWNQQVIAFLSDAWQGEPTESEEMAPKWYKTDEIPYNKMWWDDKYWIPLVLKGSKVEADFLFDKDEKIIEQNIKTL